MTTAGRGRGKKDTYDRVGIFLGLPSTACNRARPAARDFTSRSSLNVMHRRFSATHLGPGLLVEVPEQSPTSYNVHTFLPSLLLVGLISRGSASFVRVVASVTCKGKFFERVSARFTEAEFFFAGFRARRIIFLEDPVRNCSLLLWVTLTVSAR